MKIIKSRLAKLLKAFEQYPNIEIEINDSYPDEFILHYDLKELPESRETCHKLKKIADRLKLKAFFNWDTIGGAEYPYLDFCIRGSIDDDKIIHDAIVYDEMVRKYLV